MFEAVVNTDVSKNVYTMFEIVGLNSWDIQYGLAVIFIFRLFMSVMFMNMLISIIMGHYGSIRALPENQDLINAKEANAYVETYRSMKLSIQSLFTKAPDSAPKTELVQQRSVTFQFPVMQSGSSSNLDTVKLQGSPKLVFPVFPRLSSALRSTCV